MLGSIVNSEIGESIVASLADSLMDQYNVTSRTFGPAWAIIPPTERFLLVALNLDVVSCHLGCSIYVTSQAILASAKLATADF